MDSVEARFSHLSLTEEEAFELDPEQKQQRITQLLNQSYEIYDYCVQHLVRDDGRELKATLLLFSGGNDSTFLFHLFKTVADYAVHINTTIGIEETREFVRDTCRNNDVDLIEALPPDGNTYRDLILDMGFPGPNAHHLMYQRLKERCLDTVRKQFITNKHRHRVIYLSGRRRSESHRRAVAPFFDKDGSAVWCAPILNWTKHDITTYKKLYGGIPVNPVTELIHMSGECLCGAFATAGEWEQLKMFFPQTAEMIHQLEHDVAEHADVADYRKQWGWGQYPQNHHRARAKRPQDNKIGPLCSSCEYKHQT
jgi:3'-phosphoadenosine 5'-phosphosulfate sulfotransferase (PAPS reductase)/FAD synthetase